MSAAAAASTAKTSLPSTSTPSTPIAFARASGPAPAVIASVAVVADQRLSSQTNSSARPWIFAQLRPSRKGPRLTAPSPKKQATRCFFPCTCSACAAPTAIGMPAATTPFAPSMPTEKSAMCIEPPLPPLKPVARPNSSHIIFSIEAPLASVWPWPRCVEVIRSSRARLMHTPAGTASCPVDRCSGPRTRTSLLSAAPNAETPPLDASSAAFSKARMRAIVRYSASARSLELFTVSPAPTVQEEASRPSSGTQIASTCSLAAKGLQMAREAFQSCIEACNSCAIACDHCAFSCLEERDIGALARCIELDMDCASICRLAAGFMSRGSEFAPLILEACADVCDACAKECDLHPLDHCRECAEACRRCAEECDRMAAGPRPPQAALLTRPPAH